MQWTCYSFTRLFVLLCWTLFKLFPWNKLFNFKHQCSCSAKPHTSLKTFVTGWHRDIGAQCGAWEHLWTLLYKQHKFFKFNKFYLILNHQTARPVGASLKCPWGWWKLWWTSSHTILEEFITGKPELYYFVEHSEHFEHFGNHLFEHLKCISYLLIEPTEEVL